MADLTLVTLDWVPEAPRGFVRDLRVRWALEEAGLPYRVATTPFDPKTEAHYAAQPFGQVPWLEDGEVTVFESGAILQYLGEKSAALLPADAAQRDQAKVWIFAALNSVEAASLPWTFFKFMHDESHGPGSKWLEDFLTIRLKNLERALADRAKAGAWLAGPFSAADILMADVLRVIDRFDKLADYAACSTYLARATARPAFKKALADQLAHFTAADARRAQKA